MCDDLRAEIARLGEKGIACGAVSDQGWGLLSTVRLPGGGDLGLYEPHHPQLIGRATERAAGGGSRLAGRRIGRIVGAEAMKFGGWQRLHAESGSALKPPIGKENTMKPAKKGMQKAPKSTTAIEKKPKGFTEGENAVLAKIAALPQPDRAMGERLHAIIKANAPALSPKTWYGMPAYAKDGNVVCFFQSAHRFKARYATLGFSDKANLDEAAMWPTAFALKALTPTEEARIVALVQKAVS